MDGPELISCGISKYALGFYAGKIYRDCKENKRGEEKREKRRWRVSQNMKRVYYVRDLKK